MYCKKCGRENEDNAKFCQGCGNAFGVSDYIQQEPIVNLSEADIKKVKTGVLLQFIGLGVSLIGIVLYLFISYYIGLIIAIIGFLMTLGFGYYYISVKKALKKSKDNPELKKKAKPGRIAEIAAGVIMIMLGVSIGILSNAENKLNQQSSRHADIVRRYENGKGGRGYIENLDYAIDSYEYATSSFANYGY